MIRNLIDEVVEAAAQIPLQIAILQRVREVSAAPDPRIAESDEASCLAVAIRAGEAQVAAGTVWAWARSVILLGDPQQLEQPIQGSHPPGCDRSALEHLLGSHDTVPADRGLFLPPPGGCTPRSAPSRASSSTKVAWTVIPPVQGRR